MGMKPGKASTFFNQPRTLGYAAGERFEELLGELLLALGEFHLAHRLIAELTQRNLHLLNPVQ
ncbi:hypothetical protein FACS1894116_09890 [Betaproteobacteria bacterium]|nr:hypothetical protein FACS1894116_09890 [Betaproteobacteria bacterium]GHU29435.1 hypothetical protein FACS189497_07410 [Betaproteobacteria bacterium]